LQKYKQFRAYVLPIPMQPDGILARRQTDAIPSKDGIRPVPNIKKIINS
jgi:hypothetical protein